MPTCKSELSPSGIAFESADDRSDCASDDDAARRGKRPASRITRMLAYTVLPVVTLGLATAAGYTKYVQASHASAETAREQSLAAAKDTTVAMLSYSPESAATTLTAARDRLTGSLRDSYTSLVNDVVIPGAQQKHISAAANIAATASIEASENHAVVLVFVDQSITEGQGAPTATASTVRVTLDRIGTRWLVSGFDPR
jgi:Mce-associated membrane protein